MSLIHSLKEVEEFTDRLFPEDLGRGEVIIFQLIARRKYWDALKRPQLSLAKKIAHSRRNFLMKLLSVAESSYYTEELKQIPKEALALYIVPFKRNLITAVKSTVNDLVDSLSGLIDAKNLSLKEEAFGRIHKANQFLFSNLSKQSSYPCFLVDIDKKDYSLFKEVISLFPEEFIVLSLETRGGYHILIKKDETTYRIISSELKKLKEVEVKNKNYSIPIAGTLQGGFPVRIINR